MWDRLQHTLSALASARPADALLVVLLYALGLLGSSLRWRALLQGLGCSVRLRDTVLADLAFIFVNNTTPGRIAGEVVRVAALRQRTPVDLKRAVASSLWDHAVNVAQPPLFLLLALPALPHLLERLRGRGAAALAALLVLLALLLAYRTLPGLRGRLAGLRRQLQALAIPRRHLARAWLFAAAVWALDAVRLAAAAAAFGVRLAPSQAVALSLVSCAGGLVPAMGGLGVVEGTIAATLYLFGVPLETALAVTLLERAVSYGLSTGTGALVTLALGGRRLWQALRPPQAPEARR